MTEPNKLYNPYFNPDWAPTYSGGYQNKKLPQQVGMKQTQGLSFRQPQSPSKDGFDAATAVSGAVGALDLGLDIASMGDEAQTIQTKAPEAQYDAYGRPAYNLGQFSEQTSRINPRGANGGEILSGVGKGAMAGAQIGSVIPGVGTAIGAVAGGLVGGVGKVF